jgi:copper chaperone CopZ
MFNSGFERKMTMKRITTTAILGAFLFSPLTFSETEKTDKTEKTSETKKPTTKSTSASVQEVRVEVDGMVCAFCAQGVKKKFDGQEAVKSLDVRLADRLVTINLNENHNMTDEEISKLITDAGYTVRGIHRGKAIN